MKKYLMYIIIGFSIAANIFLIVLLTNTQSENISNDSNQFQERVQELVRNHALKTLYYPESYDPVEIIVCDSAFYNPITDVTCIKAAIFLIELEEKLPSTERTYTYSTGQDKKDAKIKLDSLRTEKLRWEGVIKSRDTTKDGSFIGWPVFHKYRAKDQDGRVHFNSYTCMTNPDITEVLYSLEYWQDDMACHPKYSFENIRKVIKKTLAE